MNKKIKENNNVAVTYNKEEYILKHYSVFSRYYNRVCESAYLVPNRDFEPYEPCIIDLEHNDDALIETVNQLN